MKRQKGAWPAPVHASDDDDDDDDDENGDEEGHNGHNGEEESDHHPSASPQNNGNSSHDDNDNASDDSHADDVDDNEDSSDAGGRRGGGLATRGNAGTKAASIAQGSFTVNSRALKPPQPPPQPAAVFTQHRNNIIHNFYQNYTNQQQQQQHSIMSPSFFMNPNTISNSSASSASSNRSSFQQQQQQPPQPSPLPQTSYTTTPNTITANSNTNFTGIPYPFKFRLNGALNALAASPDRQHVVVAGREVLKVLRVGVGGTGENMYHHQVVEQINLRAGLNVNINFSCGDVKWAPAAGSNSKSIIATATTNGSVIIWDINRSSPQKLDRVLTEHSRTVNRVCFHGSEPHLILSASQDGTMRLWDLRTKSIARHTFEGNAESVRDVQFNPTGNYEFAAAFENGNIQKWDMRNPTVFEKKWSAHNGLALTVDWSHDGRYLASGGRDRVIKICDVRSETRKPIHSIQTIAPVSRVAWRPGFDTQIASSALSTDFRIVVWDLSRPYVSQSAVDVHDSVTTGFQWIDNDTLWSCSKDRHFVSCDIRRGYRPADFLCNTGITWNVFGEVSFVVDDNSTETYQDLGKAIVTPPSSIFKKTSASIEKLKNGERAVADEDKIDLQKITIYQPRQNGGTLESDVFDCEAFVNLALMYRLDSDDICLSCQKNADACWDQEQYRASRTWSILKILFGQQQRDDDGGLLSRNLTEFFGRSHSSAAVVPLDGDAGGGKEPSNPSRQENQLQRLQQQIPSSSSNNITTTSGTSNPIEEARSSASNFPDFRSAANDTAAATVINSASSPSATSNALSGDGDTALVVSSSGSSLMKVKSRSSLTDTSRSAARASTTNSSGGWEYDSKGRVKLKFTQNIKPLDRKSSTKLKNNTRGFKQQQRQRREQSRTVANSDSESDRSISSLGSGGSDADSDSEARNMIQSDSESDEDIKGIYGRNILARFVTTGGAGGGSSGSDNPVAKSRKLIGKAFTGTVPSTSINSTNTTTSSNAIASTTATNSSVIGDAKKTSLSASAFRKTSSTSSSTSSSFSISTNNNVYGPDPNIDTSLTANDLQSSSLSNEKGSQIYPDFEIDPWDSHDIVHEMIDYYAEQGDVQMCVSIIMVLRDVIKVEQEREDLWVWSYVDLLRRFQLWTVATEIVNRSDTASIRAQSQESTTIHTSCSNCQRLRIPAKLSKVIQSPAKNDASTSSAACAPSDTTGVGQDAASWRCEKCMSIIGLCVLCHKTVKGVYSWCQGCGHGGHFSCLKDWFVSNSDCPSGCGHFC